MRPRWKDLADHREVAAAQARSNGKCEWCGSSDRLGVDHIYPKSKGGANLATNFQILCLKCGRWKGDLLPRECIQRIQRLKQTSDWSRSLHLVALPKMLDFMANNGDLCLDG